MSASHRITECVDTHFALQSARILRAEHLGMCFGVRRAIALAVGAAAGSPLTVLGDLVHNPTVLDDLRARGIDVRTDVEEVATAHVMISAHGAAERRVAAARARGLHVLDATCPLVRAAQRTVAALARDGFHPVIVGRRDHVEVRGLTEDLDDFDVVLEDEDVARLASWPRIGIVAQTTQRIERVRHLVALVRARFRWADVRWVDTICTPTKLRQQAAVDLAVRSDVTIVVGGAESNNTRELVATCGRHCARVFHVQDAGELRPEWLRNARVVGVTAGTSTPDAVIEDVEARLLAFANGQAAA